MRFLTFSLAFVVTLCTHLKEKLGEKYTNYAIDRYRRQVTAASNLTIEVLFVVDFAVYARFLELQGGNVPETENKMKVYYARVFDGLNRSYKGIENPKVKFTLTYSDLIIAKFANSSNWTTPIKAPPEVGSSREMVDTAAALDRFLNWVNSSRELPNFDYVVLFTGYNLTYGGATSNTGLSYPSSICQTVSLLNPMSGPVAIVEESYDTRVIGRTAQQLGRSLGSRRDLDGNFCLPSTLNIMSPNFQFPDESRASNLWKFSSCSIDYFVAYVSRLSTNGANCLLVSEPTKYISDVPAFLRLHASEFIDIDDQCRTVYSSESFLCRGIQGTDFGSICRGAYCYLPDRQTCTLILPADGTLCNNKSLCFEGVCTLSESAPERQVDCPFGDQPVIPNSDGCQRRILFNNRTFDCYQPALKLVCCKTCGDLYTGIGGCEYGDRQLNCNFNDCNSYDNYTRYVRCCRTCSVKPLSKTSDFTSAITLPTTYPNITSEVQSTVYPAITTNITNTVPVISLNTTTGSTSLSSLSTKVVSIVTDTNFSSKFSTSDPTTVSTTQNVDLVSSSYSTSTSRTTTNKEVVSSIFSSGATDSRTTTRTSTLPFTQTPVSTTNAIASSHYTTTTMPLITILNTSTTVTSTASAGTTTTMTTTIPSTTIKMTSTTIPSTTIKMTSTTIPSTTIKMTSTTIPSTSTTTPNCLPLWGIICYNFEFDWQQLLEGMKKIYKEKMKKWRNLYPIIHPYAYSNDPDVIKKNFKMQRKLSKSLEKALKKEAKKLEKLKKQIG